MLNSCMNNNVDRALGEYRLWCWYPSSFWHVTAPVRSMINRVLTKMKVLTPEALGSGSTGQSSPINMVHCTHCGIVHYTVWTIQRNLNLVFKSQHGKKWMIFFVNTNSIAANENLYKWLLTPSGTASCDNKQFGFLGDQNALCGNPRRTLNANPSYRQIHLMSSRQNIYQQSTQTGCNTPCVCCSGYVRNAHACYCVHCDHCCAWKASSVSGLVTLWESDHVTCVPLRFFSTTACCDHNHVLLFKPVSKTLIRGSSK